MKLISEQAEIVQSTIEESVNENGQKEPEYFLEGVFLQANIKNRNGRIYPIDIMKKEVERYDREYVQTHRAFGELNHPSDQSPSINLDRASHIITKIWQDGDFFKARAKILDTPCGRIVKAMIKEGCQLGVSSRALGSVTVREGVSYVNNDFHLVTAGDIVFEPSAQAAFPVGIINEDVEYELDEQTGEYVQVIAKQLDVDLPSNDIANAEQPIEAPICPVEGAENTEKLIKQLKDLQQMVDKQAVAIKQRDQQVEQLKNQLKTVVQVQQFKDLLNKM